MRPLFLCVFLAAAAFAQKDQPPQRSDAEILKTVKLPAGYTATVFASPPQAGYPTSVSAAIDGTIFVAVDENGSLGRARNAPGKPRGYVLRLRDTDGDGKADEIKKFAEMESPRGVIWDGNGCDRATGRMPGTLYVVYPPKLTAFHDTDGDGVADRQEDIITGLGFDLGFRGADHTTNGARLAHDGFIYIAVGDYGFAKATAKDGTALSMRGGGIVRVRPDGTGFEIVSRGQRNIYDVAVSPALDLFTRDNTNDGGGWNVRLSFVPPGAHMGYPTLFKNFPEEIVPPLADLGGGSPCGALWLDEPGLQNGLYTVEWGRNAVMYHRLSPNGAGWKHDEQIEWLKLTRPTDIDVDATGALYVTSWEGATFDYNGPNAGYILRVVKADAPRTAAPELGKATREQLAAHLRGPSAVLRLAAQRELLRRFHLAIAPEPLPGAGALADANPRVRAAAITALRRAKKTDAAPGILPLVADPDPIVAHLAVRALSELQAAAVCLAALDSADVKVQPGALRALHGMATPEVVAGLLARLKGAPTELRRGILNALCRLANVETPYTDPKVWWGTRPDTSGPIYQPMAWSETQKIVAALQQSLDTAGEEDARWLVQTMYKTKVDFPGLIELMLAKAGRDTGAKLTAIEGLFGLNDKLPTEAATALRGVALDAQAAPDHRAKALRLLARGAGHGPVFPLAVEAFAPLAAAGPAHASIHAAYEDFTRDAKNTKWIGDFTKLAAGPDAAKRALAQTILVNLATSTLVKGKDKESAEKAVAKSWEKPETAASLLGVIARTKAKGFAAQVDARLKDPDNTVAEAALFAHQALGLGAPGTPAPTIGSLKYEEVFAAVQKGGDPVAGKDIYLRAGCLACHTVSADEPPKGPILSAVAKIYDRAALTESLLKPSAKLAQGFESTFIKTKKGELLEGFVTREGGDSLDLRNIAGQTVLVDKADIAERGHRPQSMMPEGLLNAFTPAELASLLAYLESLREK
jgi:putative heme-binding domain-containing protein